jgi:hypothetical protein
MEKQLCTLGYWLGLICTILALIIRFLNFFNVSAAHIGAYPGLSVSYLGFTRAAVLFFLLAIASWCRTAKS